MKRFRFNLRTALFAFATASLALSLYGTVALLYRNKHTAAQLAIQNDIFKLTAERDIVSERAQKYDEHSLGRAFMDMNIGPIEKKIEALKLQLDGAPQLAPPQPVFGE